MLVARAYTMHAAAGRERTFALMIIRIASIVLSLAGILALIFGLVLWTGMALNIISLHMLLGLLAVGALWVIGIGQALVRDGSWIIAACAVIGEPPRNSAGSSFCPTSGTNISSLAFIPSPAMRIQAQIPYTRQLRSWPSACSYFLSSLNNRHAYVYSGLVFPDAYVDIVADGHELRSYAGDAG